MTKKSLREQRAREAAAKLCAEGCPGNYPTCERCHRAATPGSDVQSGKLPLAGVSDVCPLEKYHIPEQHQTPGRNILQELTKEDGMTLCANCEHGPCSVYDWGEKEYYAYCLDCPVHIIAEIRQEEETEAACC